jgi:crotonobetainyl-CoA:carnitine CoA-transferase CaiB-like acyl-CoA transferase
MAAPLDGIRVLDLGRQVSAPVVGQYLGDLGADVIKVERAGSGDPPRDYPRVRAKDAPPGSKGQSQIFIAYNRNKRSITVDLTKPEGQDIVRRLAARSDILIENYKVGDLARHGLDYQSMAAVNPRLVYCSITGYGQTGPNASRPGLDPLFQAQCGLMSVTGAPDPETGFGQTRVGISIIDLVTGYHAVMAILAAIVERNASGKGQHLDIGMLDSAMAMMGDVAQNYLLTRESPVADETMGVKIAPAGVFNCADGAIFLAGGRQHHFEALCKVLGCEELREDPRFGTALTRYENRDALRALLLARMKAWNAQALEDALGAAQVPAGVINNVARAFADPQVRHRGIAVPTPHPETPDLHTVASALRFSRTPAAYRLAPPLLGEHTRQILAHELGMDAAAIDALQASGAI